MSLSQYISRTIAVLMTSVMNKQNLFGMVKAISKAKVGDNSPCAGPLIRYVIVGHRACGYNDLHSRSSLAVVRSHLVILHRTLGSQIPCSESHTKIGRASCRERECQYV